MAPWTSILSATRAWEWSNAGAAITHRTSVFEPDGDGYTLTAGATLAEINTHINRCTVGWVVLLGPGTYALNGQIVMKTGVTLRGSGTLSTFLDWSASSGGVGLGTDCIYVSNGNTSEFIGGPSNTATWSNGYAQGTTSIILSNTTSLAIGMRVHLDQLDDTSLSTDDTFTSVSSSFSEQGDSGFTRNGNRTQQETQLITGKSGNTLTISPGIHFPNFSGSRTPEAWWGTTAPISDVGIEDMTLDYRDCARTDFSAAIFYFNAHNCWLARCRCLNTNAEHHVWWYQSSKCTVRDCYMYGATGTYNAYGVDPGVGTNDCLVENNIFHHITGSCVNENSAGCVYAYNYARDMYYVSSMPELEQPAWSSHHGGDCMALLEGNCGASVIADIIHGTGNFYTLFRNYLKGRDNDGAQTKTVNTSAVFLYAYHRFCNLVGNVLGLSGYHTTYSHGATSATDSGTATDGDLSVLNLGYSGMSGTYASPLVNDPYTVTSLMRWGNYDTVSAAVRWVHAEVPSGIAKYANAVPTHVDGSESLPNSFYLTSKPSWWGANTPWPGIGPGVAASGTYAISGVGGYAYKNPAMQCYEAQTQTGGILNFNPVFYSSSTPPTGTPVLSVR